MKHLFVFHRPKTDSEIDPCCGMAEMKRQNRREINLSAYAKLGFLLSAQLNFCLHAWYVVKTYFCTYYYRITAIHIIKSIPCLLKVQKISGVTVHSLFYPLWNYSYHFCQKSNYNVYSLKVNLKTLWFVFFAATEFLEISSKGCWWLPSHLSNITCCPISFLLVANEEEKRKLERKMEVQLLTDSETPTIQN